MSTEMPAAQRLHVVILAAGASVRFGSPKQILAYQGRSLIRRAADAAAALAGSHVTIVLGAHSREVEGELLGLDAYIIHNADWRDGLASSVRKGLLTVPSAPLGVLLMACDMPLVDYALLDTMTDRWDLDRSRIITCTSERGTGLPAIIPRRYFKALMSIKGDPGINSFFARHKNVSVELQPPEVASNIDTSRDFEALKVSDPAHK